MNKEQLHLDLVQIIYKYFNDDVDAFKSWYSSVTGGDEFTNAYHVQDILTDDLDNVRSDIDDASSKFDIKIAFSRGKAYSKLYNQALHYQAKLPLGQWVVYSDADDTLKPFTEKDLKEIKATLARHANSLLIL